MAVYPDVGGDPMGARMDTRVRGCGYRTSVALRTEKQSSPENTRCIVNPSALIHFVGKLAVSPGPTSQS
jgi:hypothetical protein